MKKIIFILLFFSLLHCITAQQNVRYNYEKGIVELEQQYIEVWKKVKRIEGFRIQLTSTTGTNSRASMENLAVQFRANFPNTPTYTTYYEPNFRLRVGNYKTKLEAYRALQQISPQFPGSFVIKDQIFFSE